MHRYMINFVKVAAAELFGPSKGRRTRRTFSGRTPSVMTFCWFVMLIFAGSFGVFADAVIPANSASPSFVEVAPFSVTASGPNHRIWKQVMAQTNANGKIIYHTNAFTELASGLNHLVGNQWVPSSENIQITPDGGEATNGQHSVHFSANINSTGCIDLVTPRGVHLRSTVLGLGYFDSASGQSVVLAQLHDSIGQLLQTSNQVIYAGALADLETNFQADVKYTHKKSGFEQDIVLRSQPPSPASLGLNPDTTTLQVWTEFYNTADPDISTNTVASLVPGSGQPERRILANQILNFGAMQMDGSG